MSQKCFLGFKTPEGNKWVCLAKPAEGTVTRDRCSSGATATTKAQFSWRVSPKRKGGSSAALAFFIQYEPLHCNSHTVLVNIVCVLQAPGRIQAFLRTLAGRSPELVRASVWLREVIGLVEWAGKDVCKRWCSASQMGWVLCRISFFSYVMKCASWGKWRSDTVIRSFGHIVRKICPRKICPLRTGKGLFSTFSVTPMQSALAPFLSLSSRRHFGDPLRLQTEVLSRTASGTMCNIFGWHLYSSFRS